LAVVEIVEFSPGCRSKIIKRFFRPAPKERSAFLQVFFPEKIFKLVSPVIHEGAEIEVVELLKKVDAPSVGRSKLEPDRGISSEGRGVSKTKKGVDVLCGSPDDCASAGTVEDRFVCALDFVCERVSEIITRRKVASRAIAQKIAKPIQGFGSRGVAEWLGELEIAGDVFVE